MCDVRNPVPESPYTIELIATEDGVAALESDWSRLSACAQSSNVFMTYSWFSAWTRRLIRDDGRGRLQPHVLLIKQNQIVVGIAPFVRRVVSRFGFRIRKLEFATYHSDYNELVVGNDVRALTHAAIDYLACTARDWELVDLKEMRDDGSRIAAVEVAATIAGLSHRPLQEFEVCPYMPIKAPWPEAMRKMGKNHLRDARKAFIRLQRMEPEGLRVRILDQPHKERDLLGRMIAVEAQKKVDGRHSEPFVGRYAEVFQSLINALGPQGSIVVLVLEMRDRLVSYELLYRCGTKLWGYQTAYDREFSKLSPGTLLICAAIDYGFKHGCDEFDFLRGMDTYKLRWTGDFRRNKRMILWNRRWLSRFAAFALLQQRARLSRRNSASGHRLPQPPGK